MCKHSFNLWEYPWFILLFFDGEIMSILASKFAIVQYHGYFIGSNYTHEINCKFILCMHHLIDQWKFCELNSQHFHSEGYYFIALKASCEH